MIVVIRDVLPAPASLHQITPTSVSAPQLKHPHLICNALLCLANIAACPDCFTNLANAKVPLNVMALNRVSSPDIKEEISIFLLNCAINNN